LPEQRNNLRHAVQPKKLENCWRSFILLNLAASGQSLSVEDRQVDVANARGIGEHVDLDDLPAPDREAQDRKWSAIRVTRDGPAAPFTRAGCANQVARFWRWDSSTRRARS
jgi:hypothetical protein